MNNKKRKNSKRRPCMFCLDKMEYIDYKNVEVISKFINIHGKILSSRVTGTCARHQRGLSTAIKRARIMALIPFISERIRR
ncbi:30S ribosomal protein S18 [Metamycoplasma sualvi]|uniref:30S ribosomal protein S18 n=1 Tax=Metamycoplasma sualvi TaxID=2125 RepID=UPI003872D0C9